VTSSRIPISALRCCCQTAIWTVSYERLDLSGGYQITPRLTAYTNIQNLLSEHYVQAFGFPALPFTIRSGIKVTFGGESGGLK